MLLDHLYVMCDSDDISVSVVASTSTDTQVGEVLNLGLGSDEHAAGTRTPDIGEAGGIMWYCACEDEDFASGSSPVVTIDLHASAAEGMTSPDTLATIVTDKTPNDGDILGRKWVPAGEIKQYVATVLHVDATLSAGKITSYLGDPSETPKPV